MSDKARPRLKFVGEAAIVVGILVVVGGVILPAVSRTCRGYHPQAIASQGNLRLIFNALSQYAEDNAGALPDSIRAADQR